MVERAEVKAIFRALEVANAMENSCFIFIGPIKGFYFQHFRANAGSILAAHALVHVLTGYWHSSFLIFDVRDAFIRYIKLKYDTSVFIRIVTPKQCAAPALTAAEQRDIFGALLLEPTKCISNLRVCQVSSEELEWIIQVVIDRQLVLLVLNCGQTML